MEKPTMANLKQKLNDLSRNKTKPSEVVSVYEPLPSIWTGSDAALLERFLKFYPRKKPRRILDATVNKGRFWKRSNLKVIGLDIDIKNHPTIVGDNMYMPFPDRKFEVVVFNPSFID